MPTQLAITSAVNDTVNNFTGKQIGLPNGQLFGSPFAPIAGYLSYLGLAMPPMAGQQLDEWGAIFPRELEKSFTVEPFQRGKMYPTGTIVTWDKPHICLLLLTDGETMTVFEQDINTESGLCRQTTRTVSDGTSMCNYAIIPLVDVDITPTEAEPITDANVVVTEHKFAHAPMKIRYNRVPFNIVTEINSYSNMSFAQTGDKPVEKLKPGKYFMLSQHGGMAKIDTGEGTTSYWINPADNVVKTFNNAFKDDPRTGYKWYGGNTAEETRPIKYKADGDDVRRNKKTEVFSFNPAKVNASIAYGQPVWIAGTCVVRGVDGDTLWGIPANPNDDGTFAVMKSYSIPMKNLSLAQMDYDPNEDELIQDVEPAEAEAFLPVRDTSLRDKTIVLKGSSQRFIDGILKPKRR